MTAIVYTSQTGHTAAYAKLLGEKTGLPVYTLKDASRALDAGTSILYLGWLFASSIRGYQKAAKRFNISLLCAVGLCDTGTLKEEVRQKNKLPAALPLFTLQGGMDRSKLRGLHKMMIGMLTKGLSSKQDRTEEEERMLFLLTHDENYVSEENTAEVLAWYHNR